MSVRLLLPVIILTSTATWAATIQIPADQSSIQDGIEAAAVGDTVLIAAGTYTESGLVLKTGVTLLGAPDAPGGVILMGQQQGRVIDCNAVQGVVLENLVVTGGQTLSQWFDDAGAGVRCLNAEVRLTDCQFRDNRASVGGGLGMRGSTVIVERCTFSDNHAQHQVWTGGGGIWSRQTTGVVRDCTFTDNTAFSVENPGDGGGLFTESGCLQVHDCTFTGNTTGAGGGGFYSVYEDSSRVVDCHFTANAASWGGAAYLEYSRSSLIRCTFDANTSTQGAGSIETVRSTNTFLDCAFTANATSAGDGGALQCWGSTLVLDGCLFRGNTAPSGGGALFMAGVDAELRDCIFQDNSGERGGAIRCQLGSPRLINCTFAGNRGTVEGGAIFLGPSGGADLDRCILAFSPDGASIAGVAATPVTLSCCDVYGNAGGDWIGGIADQLGNNGNFAADPLFCDQPQYDLRLRSISPCAEANNATCGQIGALAEGCPVVSVPEVPSSPLLAVFPATPNPFNPTTTVHFELAQAAWTHLAIVDLTGRTVRTLADGRLGTGRHEIAWDGHDAQGMPAPAGVYLAVVRCGGQQESIRLALVK